MNLDKENAKEIRALAKDVGRHEIKLLDMDGDIEGLKRKVSALSELLVKDVPSATKSKKKGSKEEK